jgi:hypothetical protein
MRSKVTRWRVGHRPPRGGFSDVSRLRSDQRATTGVRVGRQEELVMLKGKYLARPGTRHQFPYIEGDASYR